MAAAEAVATAWSSHEVRNAVAVSAASASKSSKTELWNNNAARNSPGKHVGAAHPSILSEAVATTVSQEEYSPSAGARMSGYNCKCRNAGVASRKERLARGSHGTHKTPGISNYNSRWRGRVAVESYSSYSGSANTGAATVEYTGVASVYTTHASAVANALKTRISRPPGTERLPRNGNLKISRGVEAIANIGGHHSNGLAKAPTVSSAPAPWEPIYTHCFFHVKHRVISLSTSPTPLITESTL